MLYIGMLKENINKIVKKIYSILIKIKICNLFLLHEGGFLSTLFFLCKN
nr:MAG TPA: hypothetical protein [Caudoviricetes sp.]